MADEDSLISLGDDDTTTAFPNSSRQGILNIAADSSSTITPLEQQVLDEYSRLLGNMDALNATLQNLASGPVTLDIAESLRLLERKVASVYTLLKASVYSIVLQQGQMEGEGEGDTRFDGETTRMTMG